MAQPRSLLAAGLLLAALGCIQAMSHLQIDFHQNGVTDRPELAIKGRRLQADQDVCCYEGCFAPPIDAPNAQPLPVQLISGASPVALLDCYTAATAANLTYFAIANGTTCFGGTEMVAGWAPDECPMDCAPNGTAPFTCGANAKASVFSLGYCLRLDVPCTPEESGTPSAPPSPPPVANPPSPSPPRPSPPVAPLTPDAPAEPSDEPTEPDTFDPPSPSPPSPKPPLLPPLDSKQYTCKDKLALWGVNYPQTPIKLSNKATTATNLATCREECNVRPGCQGFFYKTTGWCYLLSEVYAFGKEYRTAVQACRVVLQ